MTKYNSHATAGLRKYDSDMIQYDSWLEGDPCPRAWSAVDPRDVVREAAEYMKEQAKDGKLPNSSPDVGITRTKD